MDDTGPYRFFITDDGPSTIDVLTHVLEFAWHIVASTTSSVEAAALIKKMRQDCALVDIMMPQIDGLELCRNLRKMFSSDELKIIIVSAKLYEFDRRRAMKFGADEFLTKPIKSKTFEAQVLEIIQDRLELKFRGVRGTLPVPGPKTLKYGGNTSCVTLDFPKEQFFIFDAGTAIKALSDSLLGEGKTRKDYKAFISHPHWDHINALPFFVPLYIPGNEIEVLGAGHDDVTMRELISAQMDDIYFPINIKEFGARTYFRDLSEGTFEVDKIQVKTLRLSHPGH